MIDTLVIFLTHVIVFTICAMFGYYCGRKRELIERDHYNLQVFLEHLKNRNTLCPQCDDQDFNGHHALCLPCAIKSLREMRICIPLHIWKKGVSKANYDFEGHFQMVYQSWHLRHRQERKDVR